MTALHPDRAARVPVGDADPAVLAAVLGRLSSLTAREADHLVVQEVFGRVDTAALPAMRDLVARWRPDVVVREPAELSSCVVAEQAGLPQAGG